MTDRDRNLILIVLATIALIAYIGFQMSYDREMKAQTQVVRDYTEQLREVNARLAEIDK